MPSGRRLTAISDGTSPRLWEVRVEIRHNPSFAIARLFLEGSEVVRVQPGAMAMHSQGVELEVKMEGGLVKSVKRSVMGGAGLFVSSYTAPRAGGWVDVAAVLPGDAFTVDVDDEYVLTRGAFTACDSGLELDAHFSEYGTFIGDDDGILVRMTGRGTLVGSAFGALDRHSLDEGETITVDTGHLVSYSPTVTITSRRAAAGGGLITSAKSGEMTVFDITGPGEVLTQSRNPKQFASWLK